MAVSSSAKVGQTGNKNLSATMSRQEELAGKTVSQNGMNVTYNQNGYATSGQNYNHDLFAGTDAAYAAPSADTVTSTANRAGYGGSAYDQRYFSDAELKNAADMRAKAAAGENTWDAAHSYVEGIRAKYGYTGGADGGGYQALGNESWAAKNADDSTYLAELARRGNTPNVPTGVGSGNGGGGTVNMSSTQYSGGTDDLTAYLRELYAQNTEAELAALMAAYETNVADLDAQKAALQRQYQAERNNAAIQNELERIRFNEYALANGLNTGTAGQGTLAQSGAYQDALASLGAQEAASLADTDLALAQLSAQYRANQNQTRAQNNAALAQALYNEMIRQNEASYAQQQLQMAQAEQARANAYEYAMTLLGSGVMPEADTLAAAGIGQEQAAMLVQLVNEERVASQRQYSGGTGGNSDGGKDSELIVEITGLNDYTDAYFDAALRSISARLAQGDVKTAEDGINQLLSRSLTDGQKQKIQLLLNSYGATTNVLGN